MTFELGKQDTLERFCGSQCCLVTQADDWFNQTQAHEGRRKHSISRKMQHWVVKSTVRISSLGPFIQVYSVDLVPIC